MKNMKKSTIFKIISTSVLASCFFINFSSQAIANTNKSTQEIFTPAQVVEMQKIIKQYVIANPDILIAASKTLQNQEMAKMQKIATNIVHKNAKQLFANKQDMILGNPQGKISIVEFYDYQCHHCRDMSPIIEKIIKNNPDVKVILKAVPLFGESSKDATIAALSAYATNKNNFVKFHQYLMTVKTPIDKNEIKKSLNKAGYSSFSIKRYILKNKKILQQYINDNMKLANQLLKPTIGGVATPAFVVARSNINKNSVVKFRPGQMSYKDLQMMVDAIKK